MKLVGGFMRIVKTILLAMLLITSSCANAESWFQIDTFHQKVKDGIASGYYFVDSESISNIDDTQTIRVKYVYMLNPYAEAFDEVISKVQFKCDSNQGREVESIKYRNGKPINRWSPLSFLNKYHEITPKSILERVLPIACGQTTIAQLQQEKDEQIKAKDAQKNEVHYSESGGGRGAEQNIPVTPTTTQKITTEYKYSDGSLYIGTLVNGLPHGTGLITAPNGDRYEGVVSQGMIDGKGIMYFANGNRYEGEFFHGVQNGFGTFYYSNGGTVVGIFKNGYPTETAVSNDKDGNYFRGQYKQYSPYNGDIYNVSNQFIGKVINGKITNNQQQSTSGEGLNLGKIFGAIVESAAAYQEGKSSARRSQSPVIVSTPQPTVTYHEGNGPPAVLIPVPPMNLPTYTPDVPSNNGVYGKTNGDL